MRTLAVLFALFVSSVAQANEREAYNNAYIQSGVGDHRVMGRLSDPAVREGLIEAGPKPVVILMHGCAGMLTDLGLLNNQYRPVFNDLARSGFTVVAPDSFYAPRGSNCSGLFGASEVQRLRHRELRYALNQIISEPWVNRSRIYVFGQSEGGRTVATFGRYPGWVRSVVATGWTCYNGINADVKEPTPYLIIWASGDPKHTKNSGCDVGSNGDFYSPKLNQHWVWSDGMSKARIMSMFYK